MSTLRNIGNKVLHNDNVFFTFIRSIAASQAASWVDMGIRFLLFAVVHLGTVMSTALGCVAGGIVNCIINYRFTFHATGCNPKAVAVKYALVWGGSLLLNSYGTDLVYKLLNHWTWLETIGFRPDGYFMASTLFVSLMVSWAWNFTLQRNFVYRNSGFDRFAIAAVNLLWPGKKNIADTPVKNDSDSKPRSTEK